MGVFYHRIPLQEESKPINIRPYKYSSMKKDIIENLVREMLQQGVFSIVIVLCLHVVLVGKKKMAHVDCVLIIES